MSSGSPGLQRPDKRWSSFSNYTDIAQDVHEAVVGAIEWQAFINACHREGARVQPEDAANASGQIMSAARRLLTELRQERDSEQKYDEILKRWEGENGKKGYIEQLAETSLSENNPAFLHQFVEDIHEAAFEIGYLRAGREERKDLDDKVEDDAQGMFEELVE